MTVDGWLQYSHEVTVGLLMMIGIGMRKNPSLSLAQCGQLLVALAPNDDGSERSR